MSKGATKKGVQADEAPLFVPLLNGAEQEAFVRLRQTRFEEAWAMIDLRIQVHKGTFFSFKHKDRR